MLEPGVDIGQNLGALTTQTQARRIPATMTSRRWMCTVAFQEDTLSIAFRHSEIKTVKMLDSFEILTTSGVVLWSRSNVPIAASIINNFIRDVFIEETALRGATLSNEVSADQNPAYKKDQYTLRWTSVKDLGLIFVVGHALSRTYHGQLLIGETIFRLSTSRYYTSHG